MKAIRLHAYGDIHQFKAEEIPTPQPGPNEVLVKLVASAVNHFDLMLRQGFMAKFIPLALPATLGGDGAGVIEAVGPGVTAYRVGDRVVARFNPTGRGSNAEYGVTGLSGLAHLPDSLSFEQGAALPFVGLTGRQAVEALGVKAGDRVLVSGALGGVGRTAVHYLKSLGAHPVAGVLPHQLEKARELVGEAIDMTAPAQPSFDLAIGTALPAAVAIIDHMRDGGRIASVVLTPEGAGAGRPVTIQMVAHHDDAVMLQAIVDTVAHGDLVIPVAKTFPLDQLGEAHLALAAGTEGKIVLRH
ncbi:NADP-dependent oxidoreductase [Dyella sp. LX-66]|uniref:NADP-dependent oxidoreductase n=1 Tax=unclassified Dyella TaxID=2634549 RepID=UPI001BE0FF34|nr:MULTISPECIES: NADP-dependent oxidoreductase [unclassified Dyella]MBT2118934.1 NADP-dependent oxidoreductase [Dyella sp. LX-1]MBT2140072.1 NADP-dependent oxidoreductase [Dyella sp. LX-66]